MGNCSGQTPCGDLYAPPSRSNCSIIAIIELVIMGVVAVLCIVELWDYFSVSHIGFLNFLIIIDDVIIIVALIYLIIGFFRTFGAYAIKIGIYLFGVGGILALVILIIEIIYGYGSFWYKIIEFIIIFFLTYVLYRQAQRL